MNVEKKELIHIPLFKKPKKELSALFSYVSYSGFFLLNKGRNRQLKGDKKENFHFSMTELIINPHILTLIVPFFSYQTTGITRQVCKLWANHLPRVMIYSLPYWSYVSIKQGIISIIIVNYCF